MINLKFIDYLKFIIFIFIYYFFNSYISNSINKIYNEKELYWNNEKINITAIKESIINYQNISNLSISEFNFLNLEYIEEVKNPKISLIIPVYNQQKYLISFYMSVYNQSLKEIEIIFINDASKDNSSTIIEEFMKKDKRIIHLRNSTKKREYYSKKKGVLHAKGEYMLITSPDDLLLNNILEKAYETIKNNNLDILQYYIIIGSYKNNRLWKNLKYKSGIISYPKIKDYFYNSYSPMIFDKLIKRELFLESMQYMTEYYNNDSFDYSDNDLAIFALSKKAKSYGFLEDVGYFYNIKNCWLTVEYIYKNKHIDKIFSKLFNVTKYFFEESKDNRQEKLFGYKFFYNKLYKYRNKLFYLYKNFDNINNILDEYLNCRYFNKKEKKKIQNFKNLLNTIKINNANDTI